MSENSTQEKPLPTIWGVPDELWEIIEPILEEHDPPRSTGQPRIDQREALDAIISRMRIGEEKNAAEGEKHRSARRWVVGSTLGWLGKCQAILIRHEKEVANLLGSTKGPAACTGIGVSTVHPFRDV